MPVTASDIKKALRALADPKRAISTRRFFKSRDQADDQFIGVRVPELRKVAAQFRGVGLTPTLALLKSRVHEDRLTALFILCDSFARAKKDVTAQTKIVEAYLEHLDHVDNWDLVDSSAPKILGRWLLNRERDILYQLIESDSIWRRRVAMVATQELIKSGQATDALALAERVLDDEEDLMHKASGWMLREVGEKVGVSQLRAFLKKHARVMPRTMLRYAIEKLPADERKAWQRLA